MFDNVFVLFVPFFRCFLVFVLCSLCLDVYCSYYATQYSYEHCNLLHCVCFLKFVLKGCVFCFVVFVCFRLTMQICNYKQGVAKKTGHLTGRLEVVND